MPTDQVRSRLLRVLDVATSIATLLACLVTVTWVIHNNNSAALLATRPRVVPGLRNGMTIPPVSGIHYRTTDQTLLLVMGSHCPFCKEELPHYQEFFQAAKRSGRTQVAAVFTDNDRDAQEFLRQNDVTAAVARIPSLGVLSTAGTPTVLLLDRDGRLKDFWVGVMPESFSSMLLSRL